MPTKQTQTQDCLVRRLTVRSDEVLCFSAKNTKWSFQGETCLVQSQDQSHCNDSTTP